MYVYIYIHMYVYMYVCVYIYVCMCIYICIYISEDSRLQNGVGIDFGKLRLTCDGADIC